MFMCQKCKSSALRPTRVVVERKMVNHLLNEKDDHGRQVVARGPRGGMGTQIVKELALCDGCASTTAEAPLEYHVPEKAPKLTRKIELEGFEAHSDAA